MAGLVSILVPWAPAGPERDASWLWIERRLRLLLPEAEICTGAPDVTGHPGIFSRSLALNRAAEQAQGDVFLVCDADTTYTDAETFEQALALGEGALWTLPLRYVRLGKLASRSWLKRTPDSPPPKAWEQSIEQEYPFANSGVVVIPREAFETVGGFDERFRGWGGEDDAMRAALEALWGPPARLGVALHLWHPRPLEHTTSAPYNAESRVLADRYGAAVAGGPDAMRALISEER